MFSFRVSSRKILFRLIHSFQSRPRVPSICTPYTRPCYPRDLAHPALSCLEPIKRPFTEKRGNLVSVTMTVPSFRVPVKKPRSVTLVTRRAYTDASGRRHEAMASKDRRYIQELSIVSRGTTSKFIEAIVAVASATGIQMLPANGNEGCLRSPRMSRQA